MKIQKLSNSSFHEDADLAKKINEIIDVIQEDEKNGMYEESQEDEAIFSVMSISRMESMMPVQRYEYIKANFTIIRKK